MYFVFLSPFMSLFSQVETETEAAGGFFLISIVLFMIFFMPCGCILSTLSSSFCDGCFQMQGINSPICRAINCGVIFLGFHQLSPSDKDLETNRRALLALMKCISSRIGEQQPNGHYSQWKMCLLLLLLLLYRCFYE